MQCCHLDEKVLFDFEKRLPELLLETQISFDEADIEPIMKYLAHDKKNKGGKVQFVLLEALAKPVLDVEVAPEMMRQALAYIFNKLQNR